MPSLHSSLSPSAKYGSSDNQEEGRIKEVDEKQQLVEIADEVGVSHKKAE